MLTTFPFYNLQASVKTANSAAWAKYFFGSGLFKRTQVSVTTANPVTFVPSGFFLLDPSTNIVISASYKVYQSSLAWVKHIVMSDAIMRLSILCSRHQCGWTVLGRVIGRILARTCIRQCVLISSWLCFAVRRIASIPVTLCVHCDISCSSRTT